MWIVVRFARLERAARIASMFALLVVANATEVFGQCECGDNQPAVEVRDGVECLGAGVGQSCCDCLRCREHLFGDWFGARGDLAERGIVVELPFTQFYQGVASGGVEQTSRYGGKLDYLVTLQGQKLGLNEGFTAILHAETRYGEDANGPAGSLALPNVNMLWPLPGETETSISGVIVMQALSEEVALAAGKFNGLDLFNMLYPNTGRGIDGFMNTSFLLPPTLFRTTGLSFNGAGVLGLKGPQIQSAVLVYDTQSSSTTVAPDLFDEGAVVLGYHRFFTDFGGLAGSHGFLANYSNRTYVSTDALDWTVIPGEGLAAGPKVGSWSLAYFLDQVIWQDCCDERRNLRLFSAWGLADGNPNPYRWSGNVQVQGSGLIHGRESDTMGAGYFYNGLSSEFKTLVSAAPAFDIQDIQGVEFYYNAAITPWFHLTGDLQIVDNQNVADDTSVILGLRAKVEF